LYNYEAHYLNHILPSYGIYGTIGWKSNEFNSKRISEKLTGFKKSSGPPYWHFSKTYPPISQNHYLSKHSISKEEIQLFQTKNHMKFDFNSPNPEPKLATQS
jgi:hypothetical protein